MLSRWPVQFKTVLFHSGIQMYSSLTMLFLTEQVWRPSWSTPGKSEQLPLALRWPDQPPTLQSQAAQVIDAQNWPAGHRCFGFIPLICSPQHI